MGEHYGAGAGVAPATGNQGHLEAINSRLRSKTGYSVSACHSTASFWNRAQKPTSMFCYNRIDIALDPFPCVGGTTSMDTMWMGVPLITLAGGHCISRMGVSILTNVGMPELIAQNQDEYIRLAVGLALDRERLRGLRHNLRDRVAAQSADRSGSLCPQHGNSLQGNVANLVRTSTTLTHGSVRCLSKARPSSPQTQPESGRPRIGCHRCLGVKKDFLLRLRLYEKENTFCSHNS